MAYTATIVRERNKEKIHIRISKDGPQTGGDVEVIEILSADDEDALKKKALLFVQEKLNSKKDAAQLIASFH